MLSKLLYYCFIYPLSKLPLRFLYALTDTFYLLIVSVIPYRKEVVRANLRRSFPDKTEQEIKQISKKFYRHFCDLLAESIKNLSIEKKSLLERVKVVNPALMQTLFDKEKSVLLVSGHYNNWEWMITAQHLLFPHQAVGIGQPMTSKFLDKKINARRARFGMRIVHAKNVKSKLGQWENERLAVLTLSDQSPANTHKSYWMEFLHQPTAVLFGAEMMAHQHDMAVVYYEMRKKSRGNYEIELKLITDTPSSCSYGEITEKHTRLLEETIRREPAYWIWSHKRWKRTLPEDFEALRKEQQEQFEARFALKS